MSEKQGVTQVNVSVPKALKARMEEIGRAVNWSSVATSAFEAEVAAWGARKEGATMEEIVASKKKMAEQDDNEKRQEGIKAGKDWAKGPARPRQLKRLAKSIAVQVTAGEGNAAEWVDVWTNGLNHGIARGLQEAIEGKSGDGFLDYWEDILGEDPEGLIEDKDFAEGFIEGALEVWEAISDKV